MLDPIVLEKDSQQKRIVSSKVLSRPKNRNKLEITCRNLRVDLFLFQNRSAVRLKTALRTKDETGLRKTIAWRGGDRRNTRNRG